MGFYGNITNTARTQFQFDRTYSSRYEMDMNCLDDEVYAGRYVLVEYDNIGHDGFIRVWKINDKFYTQNVEDINVLLTVGNTERDTVVYEAPYALDTRVDPRDYKDCKFYICVSDMVAGSTTPAEFQEVSDGDQDPVYTTNYNIDINYYGKGRGYDSTVWQKVYTEGTEKYVMIAELNTVVPRFDVVAEAPTMNPVVPHFDTESTDVYYKLHWQAPWGFRIAEADPANSDITTTWTTTEYIPQTGKNETTTREGVNAAIYFNKKAFNPYPDESGNWTTTVDGENEIKVIPVSSGLENYTDHEPGNKKVSAEDIQEMTINLPGIGNMMSNAWDIIHGPNRDDARTDENSSLKGRLESFNGIKNNQIPVKRAEDGTLVGSKINDALLYDEWDGKPDEILKDDGVTPEFARDDAWIETIIDTTNLKGGAKLGEDGGEYDQSSNSGISIHHTFHPTDNSISTVDKNTGEMSESETYKSEYIRSTNKHHNENDNIDLYVPYVDAKGHVVGHNIETITLPYSYRFFETQAVSSEEKDLYTTVVSDENGANTSSVTASPSDLTADRTQDTFTINPGNKWIQTKLSDENDELIIAHEIHAVDEVAQFNNLNSDEAEAQSDNDKITVQDLAFDAAGHVTENRKHTYVLPFGFKTIKTNGRGDDEVSENATETPTTTDIVADNTQDSLNINSGNKWIRIDTDATVDSITIRHDVHKTSSDSNTTDWTQEENNTTIPTVVYTYDEAGHYVSHHTENYQLPYGYGKIKGDVGNTAATATYDELTFSSDNWLKSEVTEDEVKYSHTAANPNNKDKPITDNVKPDFGTTFTIVDPHYDEMGHWFGNTEHKVELPLPEINELVATGSSVLTGINMESATGKITQTNANVGSLVLTEFNTLTVASEIDLSAKDKINEAFGKLELRVKTEENARKTAIATEVADRNTAIENAVNGLDVSDTEIDGQYVSEVSETDGKINVKRKPIPVYTLTTGATNGTVKFNDTEVNVAGLGNAAYTDSSAYATAAQGQKADSALQLTTEFNGKTIQALLELISELQTEVNTLKEQVKSLLPEGTE